MQKNPEILFIESGANLFWDFFLLVHGEECNVTLWVQITDWMKKDTNFCLFFN